MVLIDRDLRLVESAHAIGNIRSLGGAMTTTEVTDIMHSLWDMIGDEDLSSSVVGEYEYRCVYVRNYSPSNETIEDCYFWIEQNTVSPYTDIDVAVGRSPAGDDEQTITNEDTPPVGVFWTFAPDESEAQYLGSIAAGQGKSIWIRRHAGPARSGSSYQADNYILMFKLKKVTGVPPPPGGGPPPPQGNDPFGVKMIYATNTSTAVSAPFYMNMNDPESDCRFMTQTAISRHSDNTWSMPGGARIRAFTSGPDCRRQTIWTKVLDTYDHDIWGEREWMNEPNDWKNVEITCYFRGLTFSTDPTKSNDRKLYLYSRGHRHNTNQGAGCSGTAYKGVTYQEQGELKWHKEHFHDGSQPCGDRNIESFKTGVAIPGLGPWWGMKVMMWNFANPSTGLKNVHLELWMDLLGTNAWVKMGERNDEGGWYAGSPDTSCPGDEYCGGHQDQIILWGGPITEMRMDDGYDRVGFKWFSCREIVPGQTVVIPPPPGPEPPPPPPPTGNDSFGTKNIYPSKSGGSLWTAVPWANGVSRTLDPPGTACIEDPEDNRLRLSGTNDPRVMIDGAGIMKVTSKPGLTASPRVTVTGSWRNVESTVYIRVPTVSPNSEMDIRPKTDHYCTADDNVFGGYIINPDFEGDNFDIQKEKSHTIGYSPSQDVKPVTLNSNVWYGAKAICYNIPGTSNVKLEGWVDSTDGVGGGTWTKISEAIDDGTWSNGGSADTLVCGQSAIRTDVDGADGYVEYKKWTIREIEPPV